MTDHEVLMAILKIVGQIMTLLQIVFAFSIFMALTLMGHVTTVGRRK